MTAAPNTTDDTFTHYDDAGKRTEHPRPRCECGGILDAHPTIDAATCRVCGKEITGEEHYNAMQKIVENARQETP
jgi:hypothetical protein